MSRVGKYPVEIPTHERGKNVFDADKKGGPLSGTAAEVTVERPLPHKPENAQAVSIDTRPGTNALEDKVHEAGVENQEEHGSCDPGPDAELESLVLPEDKR